MLGGHQSGSALIADVRSVIGELRAQEARTVAASAAARAAPGVSGLGVIARAEARRDVQHRGVGLLGCEPALLDRQRRAVAGGVDIVEARRRGL